MKNSKKMFSASLAACMALGTASLFPMTANAAAYNWDARPDWTPHDFKSAMDFLNSYGATHIEDGMICIVQHVPNDMQMTANIDSKGYRKVEERTDVGYDSKIFRFDFELPEKPDEDDVKAYAEYESLMRNYEFSGIKDSESLGYHYEALMICENSDSNYTIDVTIADKENTSDRSYTQTYTFDEEKETDYLGWLPDSYPEFQVFVKDNGNISYHDGKMVYADSYSPSTGASISVDQTGTGKLKEVLTMHTYDEDIAFMLKAGGTSHIVKLYEGEEAGNVDITFKNGREWAAEDENRTEQTAHVRVSDSLKLYERFDDMPDWIPQDSKSLAKFLNEHGKTWIQDGIICTARYIPDYRSEGYIYSYGGSAAEDIKNYTIFSDVFSIDGEYDSVKYEVMAYKIPNETDLTINFDFKFFDDERTLSTFNFSKDYSGYIFENDIYSWLPDCDEEFENYYKKHGAFSIQDGYIMYCTNLGIGTGFGVYSAQDGTGAVIEALEEDSMPVENMFLDGGSQHVVKLFKPTKEGTVKLTLYQARDNIDIIPDNSVNTAYFKIDSDMNITPAEESDMKSTVKGDCNGDGIIGISDAVTLQNWLHGKGTVSEYGLADANGDGVVDVFDLITLKKKIITSMSAEPEPVMVKITGNFACSPHQTVQVYDQYGTVYNHAYSDDNTSWDVIEQNIINMDSDDWYEDIRNIMDTAIEETTDLVPPKSKYCVKRSYTINDRLISDIADFSKNAEKYSDTEMLSMGYAKDMGSTTIYTIGKTADGKPVYAELATFGDAVGYIDVPEVKDFIQMLVDHHMFAAHIFNVMNR